MRIARWIPIAFLADLNGFALFAPYAIFILSIYLLGQHQKNKKRLAAVRVV